ncbi:MAG: AmmeMemoRadiSam system radical SAM enzyme [Verrucomicrobia bacterium]|jgi:pyruvate formate lyase activating enzyme|nr:AmmeMemoRadiSam system radical SAM enzyme [Verrucomicrobiota bacterium]
MLAQETIRGELWHPEGDKVRCVACGHRCLIARGHSGICKVRFNRAGELRVPFGYVAGVQSDPVEKKPFFHVLPGSDALTFGMLGCDFHCGYCQNWITSQALRDPAAKTPVQPATPRQLVDAALRLGSRLVVSSYNEPLITSEWAVAVFREARPAGLLCAYVSNGNATAEVLDYLKPWIAAYKIDLKGFDDHRYRSLGGTLANVCRGIEMVLERGIWLEVVTLVVPGFNDSETELRAIAKFLAGRSRDIPWHVTAFHPDYKMEGGTRTPAEQLVRAAEIGVEEGLRFVYAGNLPGQVGRWENTHCASCGKAVVERAGYQIRGLHLTPDGTCEGCGATVPGLWFSAQEARATMANAGTARFGRGPRQVRLDRQTL